MIGVRELGLCKPDFVSGEGSQADPAHLNVLKWPGSFTAQKRRTTVLVIFISGVYLNVVLK